jgi:hypothetical protein
MFGKEIGTIEESSDLKFIDRMVAGMEKASFVTERNINKHFSDRQNFHAGPNLFGALKFRGCAYFSLFMLTKHRFTEGTHSRDMYKNG